MAVYIAIDIGGTDIKYGLMNEKAEILQKDKMPTEAEKGGSGILDKVLKIISKYENQAEGVCISSAGMVDTVKGRIFYAGPTIPNYAGTEFKKTVEDKFHLPCEIENDVNCAGLAEAKLGAARGCSSVLCLTVGTGIGGCFVLNGEVYHGHSGSSCEIGYMHMRGSSFEQLGATSVLRRRVAERKKLPGDQTETWSGRKIFEAAREGDPICREEIDSMCEVLGEGIANICYVLNPEIVVLGGGIMAQKDYLLPRIRKALDKALVSSIAENTKLAVAERGNDAGMTGALLHFLQKHEK